MVRSLKWLFLLTLTGVHAQEPRKKSLNDEPLLLLEQNDDDVSCSVGGCVKRSPGQDEFGPFWANRGKKDPIYMRNKLFADEPHWILFQNDQKENENAPFFVARGKKSRMTANLWRHLFGSKKHYDSDI